MAAPAKTSERAVIDAALELARATGSNFSINAVAQAVGVKPSSLYKRFNDRSELFARMQVHVYELVREALVVAPHGDSPIEHARSLAQAYWRFALENPKLYELLIASEGPENVAVHEARLRALAPALEAVRAIAGEERTLEATRAFTALIHGFVSMTLANAFHLGGDIEHAFTYAIDAVLRGIAVPPSEFQQTQIK